MDLVDEADFRDFASPTRQRVWLVRGYRYSGNWQDAEDLLQHALTQVYLNWSKLVHDGNLDAWVHRVMFNKFVDQRRSAWSRFMDHFAEVPEVAVRESDIIDLREPLMAALLQLPRNQRAVLVCYYWEDMEMEAIAQQLGLSLSNVKVSAHRGRKTLKKLLSEGVES